MIVNKCQEEMSRHKPPYKTRKFAKNLGSSLKTSELPLKTSEVLL